MPATEHLAIAPTPASLLAGLNPEQLAAVTLPPCHALILAGAGSGKTRVLTTRIAWLLHNRQAAAAAILAVTFTNKAAREMLTRLTALLPLNVRGMWIGTFHGLCNRLLRAHHRAAGLPQAFQILDTQDQLAAVKRLCKEHEVDQERFPARQLAYFISGCKEEGLRPAGVPVGDGDTRRKVEIYQLYEAQCQREGVVDFGELMLRSYELLRDNDALRAHYQQRFAHILVDEFQDTNRLQYAWLKQLAGGPASARQGQSGQYASVMAVGDDDQSIYAFRGARVGNMADFVREFQVREQIKLEQNYRSQSNILDSANALISHNRDRLGKNLRTEQGPGEPVRVFHAASDLAEAQWLVGEIGELTGSDALARSQIAVLYRSNAQSRVLESALFSAGVPYRVYGGLRFFERTEIKHALAWLRLLENAQDDTSFLRVVNFPPRGIGGRSIEALQDAARSAGCALHDAAGRVAGNAGAKLGAFVAQINALRAQTQGLGLRAIIEKMLDASGLLAHYRSEKDGAERVENLGELINAAESFVMHEGFGLDAVALPPGAPGRGASLTQSPVSQGLDPSAPALLPDPPQAPIDVDTGETLSPLAAFLTHAALEAGDNQAQAGQDAVQLMTVHASKGLEFDAVFVAGLEEGLFPHEQSAGKRSALEEERRLMYVAITRARKRLYLSHAQTRMLHGQTRYNQRSRFLDELPAAALKWVGPPAAANAHKSAARNQDFTGAASRFGYQSARLAERFASPPVPAQKSPPEHGLRVGIAVFHNKFGEGRVLALEGQGADARAHVHFPRHGNKWLALLVAKLTLVE